MNPDDIFDTLYLHYESWRYLLLYTQEEDGIRITFTPITCLNQREIERMEAIPRRQLIDHKGKINYYNKK